jgi:tRNA dimethylallyltransferase
MKPLLVVISGPTASGKTAFAIELALHFKTEIISFDSRQFYREMKIGTAPPTIEQLDKAPHHFIHQRSVVEEYNAADFGKDALKKIQELSLSNQVIIMVGGSGLYLDAVLFGFDEMPTVDVSIREQLNKEFSQYGIAALQQELKEKDLVYFEQVDQQNPVRIIRALEVIRTTNQSFSSYRTAPKKLLPDVDLMMFSMDLPREELYGRIHQRVDSMMQHGLLKEVKSLLQFKSALPIQTVGYTELIAFIEGSISLDRAVDQIKQHTRNYAKRQLTWLKKYSMNTWIHPGDVKKAIIQIETHLSSR